MQIFKKIILLIFILIISAGSISGCIFQELIDQTWTSGGPVDREEDSIESADHPPIEKPEGQFVILEQGTYKRFRNGDVIPCNTKLHAVLYRTGAKESMPVWLTWYTTNGRKELGKTKIDGASNAGGDNKISIDIGEIPCDEALILEASKDGKIIGRIHFAQVSAGGKTIIE